MAIKRYYADKDNTITNAFQSDLTTRGTGSNMGLADSLEVFYIYAQESSASAEKSRVLLQFPVTSSDISGITTILADRQAGKIPASGSVDFYLRMYNVASYKTLPKNFTLNVFAVSQSWEEGNGVDLDNYTDLTYDGTGSNWINAAAQTEWVDVNGDATQGGSYLTSSVYDEFIYEQTFGETGTGDLEVKITGLVEQWILGTGQNNPAGDPGFPNYGVGVMLTSSQESGSQSYYSKMFSARGSEYFFSRPVIEARWDSSQKDNRGNFVLSSSALSSDDNLNTLYFYNYHRGQPTNIAGVGPSVPIYVSVFTSRTGTETITTTPNNPVTGGWVSTGVYSASFALNTTESVVYDRWFSASADNGIDDATSTVYNTGSITIVDQKPQYDFYIPDYVTTITNLKQSYKKGDTARFRLFTRMKDWHPTIYTVASTEIRNSIVDDAYFKVYRTYDNKEVVAYGTGSLNHTRLSYDVSGSYFDFDMSMLEPDYIYGIKFLYYSNGEYHEQKEVFKFRVEE